MRRAVVRLLTVALLVGAALLAPASGAQPPGTAHAADLSFFDPGNIIADAVFYDSLSMDAPAVQAFLDAKGAYCTAGTLCLKNYRVTTTDRAGDNLCRGYAGAANESAAVIITKVAVSCGVSPRVLLVLLQKEQGLVTATSPTAHKIDRAAGYYCPDSGNGWCAPGYAGLENQLYWSAWQYKKYRAYPDNYSFLAGQQNRIAWHPNSACGSSTVYIANQATAGLYDYTPYRPNQAALSAGYGMGDSCSSYGNRNFWNYFTDWFGSTQSAGGAAIYAKYQALGGASSPLGRVTSTFFCGLVNGGCYQVFEKGSIYWTPSLGAHMVTGAIRDKWFTIGIEWGTLGYPLTDTYCGLTDNGCFQHFERGSLYYSPDTGTHFVRGAIRDKWSSLGWENSSLGYPTTDEICGLTKGGCYQFFTGGAEYWTSTLGAHVVSGEIQKKWGTLGNEWGTLGYPVNDTNCTLTAGGCYQKFQFGSLYTSTKSGTHLVRGAIRIKWGTLGWEHGSLGYPTSDEQCGLAQKGCFSNFQNGSVFWTPTLGALSVSGPLQDAWTALGREAGTLGYPTRDGRCDLINGGCLQYFQGGVLYWSKDTGGHFARGAILARWGTLKYEAGSLGYPITDEICGLKNGGCFEHFEKHGSIYWTPATGAHSVSGPIRDAWEAQGWETGSWGYPTDEPTSGSGGVVQHFTGGTATYSETTGKVTFQ